MCEHNHKKHCHNKHFCDSGSKKILFLRAGISLLIFFAAFKFHFSLFIIAYLIIGYDILFKAVKNLFKGEMFDECFLMSLATIGAICIKEFPESFAVMLLYQIGEFLQDCAVDRSKASISELMNIRPDFARIIRTETPEEEKTMKIPPQKAEIGDIILVKAGEKIPLDGVIIEGEASVDLSSLTGESLPKYLKTGDEIYSGSVNLDSVLKIKVTKSFEQSTVSKILDLAQNAKEKKTKTEAFITRFARIYTPAVVILAFFIAIVPQYFFQGNWVERALTFLVISCPCALVISIPLGFFAGIGKCAKKGILVKGSVYLERLSKLKSAVFDKTGTLTSGKFKVVSINSSNPDILRYAAFSESASSHPIAVAIKEAYNKEIPNCTKIREIAGKGVIAQIDGNEILCGSAKLLGIEAIESTETVVYVSVNGNYIGNIVISDTIKPNSEKLIENLNKMNIATVMLTGDIEKTAIAIQKKLGIKTVFSGLLPNEKVEKIEEIIKKTPKGFTLFVGDGINDAPVIQRADIGAAMGGLGADAAIEASDVVIMDDNPEKLLAAIEISRKIMVIIKQNIAFSISIKVLFLLLGSLGFMTMWGAVFADVGVTFLAILNALRILR